MDGRMSNEWHLIMIRAVLGTNDSGQRLAVHYFSEDVQDKGLAITDYHTVHAVKISYLFSLQLP
jgi:hypothetical protein